MSYNPTQRRFNEIHSEIVDEMTVGDELHMAVLFELIRSYNDVCRTFGWDINHELNFKFEESDGKP